MYPDAYGKRQFGKIDAIILGVVAVAIGVIFFRLNSVLHYRWDWAFLPNYLIRTDEETGIWSANILLQGLLATIRISILSMILASFMGVAVGLMRASRRLFFRVTGRAYVELIRNLPPLIFIFVFYFFISSQLMPLLGLDEFVRSLTPGQAAVVDSVLGPPGLLENLIAGVLCLAMFEAAYIAEIVRAGIQAVPRDQIEAGQSLGLSRWKVSYLIVLPQAMRKVIPPLANQFIMLIKDSSIISLISVQELTFLGTEVAVSTHRVFETWIAVAAMYFAICFALSRIFARAEARLRSKD